jgi:hypothetical protein
MSKVARRIKRGYRRSEAKNGMKAWAIHHAKRGDQDAQQWLKNKKVKY